MVNKYLFRDGFSWTISYPIIYQFITFHRILPSVVLYLFRNRFAWMIFYPTVYCTFVSKLLRYEFTWMIFDPNIYFFNFVTFHIVRDGFTFTILDPVICYLITYIILECFPTVEF